MAAKIAYAKLEGPMILENAHQISRKVTLLDVFVYIGPSEDDVLKGAVRYFNNSDDTEVVIKNGMYQCQIKPAQKDSDANATDGVHFIGDLKSACAPWSSCIVILLNVPKFYAVETELHRSYLTVAGVVTKSSPETGTFEAESEQYTLSYADAKKTAEDAAARASVPAVLPPRPLLGISGYFNSQRYKKNKPVPYLDKYTLVSGLVTGVSEALEGSAVKQRFLIEVDDVVFINLSGGLPKAAPPATPASGASGSTNGSGRFSQYTSSRKRARTEDTPRTSSPSPSGT
ncbi:hypothetical protein C8R46DRAFT_1353438 [Mycena filopes]|nr:hypothetical protein C8R46DRAFT_1194134 [Mycena filopes]KAJ7161668.1 hypothetical protein C8R46DRAFT_1353438 [Mycena filopes]